MILLRNENRERSLSFASFPNDYRMSGSLLPNNHLFAVHDEQTLLRRRHAATVQVVVLGVSVAGNWKWATFC